MDAEQTWPTEAELEEADERKRTKLVKRVPQGFSEYQAAWIPDCDAGNYGENEERRKIPNPCSCSYSFPEHLSDVSDLEEENEPDLAEDSDADMSVDGEEKESRVTFADCSSSEYLPEPNEYDKQMDMEEENSMLQKLKGIFTFYRTFL